MNRRSLCRVGLLSVVVLSATFLVGTNFSSASEAPFSEFREQAELPPGQRDPVAPPAEGITVVTSHLGPAGSVLALNANGTVLHFDDAHDGYWDVDPAQEGERTVVYAATDEVHDEARCDPVDDEDYCVRQVIEKANLTTGETTVLYSRVDPRYHASEWHDVDQINETHYVVADMYADEVFVVNTTSGTVVWEWSLQEQFALEAGGQYPDDWAHLNDVELLDDGRLVLSPRNMDQVVFVDPRRGTVDDAWTLGADDRHETLYEQHNPDYIPESNGGPALLVADSENNRIVEYQRGADGWNRTWVWRDTQLQWARDADRLPNGHTLVTDTHGGRVVEVNTAGEVVWSVDVPTAYESERLNTGDESEGGPSAVRSNLTSQSLADARETAESGSSSGIKRAILGLFPSKVINGVENVTPTWVGTFDLVAALTGVFVVVLWVGLEARWSDFTLRSPITRERR